ncbi:hypothetical protein QZH41_014054 [Actinostola sp. cb2023]|nr:hypothetical protein QZH41_014054 [Actinostola sp. cb2023]
MASKLLPLVVIRTHGGLPAHCQSIIDNHANEMNMIPFEQLSKEQHSMVQGLTYYGLPTKLNAEGMDLFPNLRVIASVGAGTDHIDIDEATKRGIKVGNTPFDVQECTADLGFALLLASARNVIQGDAACKSPNLIKYDVNFYGQKVSGSTIGIVGLGGIGSAVAERAKGFKMKILYHSRTRKEHLEKQIGIKGTRQPLD